MNRHSWNRRATAHAAQRVIPLMALLVALMALLATMVGPVGVSGTLASNPGAGAAGAQSQANTENEDNKHCPDHSDNPKAEDEGTHRLEVGEEEEEVFVVIEGSEVRFEDAEGNPITVEFCIKSAQEQSGKQIGSSGESPATNDKGEPQDISYVVVYRIVVEPPVCPHSLELTPAHGENQLGDTHTVTATVTDGENACPGIEVRFEVDPAEGAEFLSDQTVLTGPDGTATFSYTRDDESNDTITACTTDEGEAPVSCDTTQHIYDTATKDWVVDEVEFFCRSDVITVGLGGDDVLIPFEANEPSEPCATDADGLLVALSPLLGEGGLGILNDKNQIELSEEGFGSLTLDLLWARTEAGDDSAHADSGVLFFVANDGTDDQIILEVGTSENSTDAACNNSTMATLLAITLAGERFEVTGGNVVLIDPALDDLVIIRIEDGNDGGADEGPDDTGAQALDVGALMNNITATVADSESGCAD